MDGGCGKSKYAEANEQSFYHGVDVVATCKATVKPAYFLNFSIGQATFMFFNPSSLCSCFKYHTLG